MQQKLRSKFSETKAAKRNTCTRLNALLWLMRLIRSFKDGMHTDFLQGLVDWIQ